MLLYCTPLFYDFILHFTDFNCMINNLSDKPSALIEKKNNP